MTEPVPVAPASEPLRAARLRDLAQRIDEAELVVALDGRIVDANDRACALYGYPMDTLLELHVADLRAEETRPEVARQMAEAAEHGVRFETRHRRRDGSEFPVEVGSWAFEVEGQRYLHSLVRDLTARHLQDAETRLLASITRSITDTVFVTDLDVRLVRSLSGDGTLLGYTPAEFVGMRPSERFEAEFPDADYAPNCARLLARAPVRLSARLKRKDTTRVDVDATVTPILDASGAPCGFVGILRDITHQRAAERALRLSEDRFRSFFEQSKDAIILTRSDGAVVAVNAAALALFGLSEAEFRSMDRNRLVVGDALQQALARRARTGEVVAEMTFVRGDGRTFLGAVSSSAFGTHGEHTLYASTVRDISEARRLTAALQQSEAMSRAILSAMAEGVVVMNAQGHIVTCNASAERILGLTRGQVVGREPIDPAWQAVCEDERPFPTDQNPVAITLRTGEPQAGVVMGVHLPDGTTRWLLVSTECLGVEGSGEPSGVVATFSDITERQRLIQALEALRSRLAFALEGAEDGVWDCDARTGEVDYSPRWAGMIGYRVDELGRDLPTWIALIHPDDRDHVQRAVHAHLAGETPHYESEFRMRHKDGRWIWILSRGKVVSRDAEGRALRAAGTHVDITARREAEEALRESVAANERLVAELREAAQKIKTLTGFIPICMFCKKIRDDQGYWERIEAYISAHSDAKFSHGLCPECRQEHYGDL